MQITLNIPDNTSKERVQQVINELADKLQLQIDLISTKSTFLESETQLKEKLLRWQLLFKKTQSLPQVKNITEADIETEIAAYRSGS
ncbi:MAG: hypothetical protein EPN17_11635 [Methylobacter sp.]|nr:MAG: hypothetical protein EPN17_11635 [Methylobacter sp.]